MAYKYNTDLEVKGKLSVIGDLQVNNIISNKEPQKVTYDELKALRDNGKLIPDKQYIITDYITTIDVLAVSSDYLNCSSADHKFDIIVTAKTNNELSEDAKVTHHIDSETGEIDSYFKYNELDKWELKYCLDNDSYRFDWAVKTPISAGDHYIVTNSVGYDSKGLITDDWSWLREVLDTNTGERKQNVFVKYVPEPSFSAPYYLIIESNDTSNFLEAYNNKNKAWIIYEHYASIHYVDEYLEGPCISVNWEQYNIAVYNVLTEIKGKGVIYYMKDEFNNELPYDFKNIKFNDKYTFNYVGGNYYYDSTSKEGTTESSNRDASSSEVFGVYNNSIQPSKDLYTTSQILSYNIFEGEGFHDIYLGQSCERNTFKTGVNNVVFDHDCTDNSISYNGSNIKLFNSSNITIEKECDTIELWNSSNVTIGIDGYDILIDQDAFGDVYMGSWCKHIKLLHTFATGGFYIDSCSNIRIENVSFENWGNNEEDSFDAACTIRNGCSDISISGPASLGSLDIGYGCKNIKIDTTQLSKSDPTQDIQKAIKVAAGLKNINFTDSYVPDDSNNLIEFNEGDCIYV